MYTHICTYIQIHAYIQLVSGQQEWFITHCNKLQQAATRCNTLQHTATHCNTLQHFASGHRGSSFVDSHTHTHTHTYTHTSTHKYTRTRTHTHTHTRTRTRSRINICTNANIYAYKYIYTKYIHVYSWCICITYIYTHAPGVRPAGIRISENDWCSLEIAFLPRYRIYMYAITWYRSLFVMNWSLCVILHTTGVPLRSLSCLDIE